jgi:hypothetical protein
MVAGALFIAGCADDIDSAYGQRSGQHAISVNGTRVFSDMFEYAGHRVSETSYLSPALGDRTDVFVWFPDDFKPPAQQTRAWFEAWLRAKPGRSLIYVGRDYDAAADYWSRVQAGQPAEQLAEMKSRQKIAETIFASLRSSMPKDEDCDWFVAKGTMNHRDVRKLSGTGDWLADIDPAKVEITLNGRFESDPGTLVLLGSERDPLVTRRRVGRGRLYVVTNGSFLLNLPLVNHEHRKLAGKLIDAVGDDKRVVFAESGSRGLPIRDKEPDNQQRSGLEIFGIAPFDLVFLHLSTLGLIFCFSRYVIFGRPRDAESVHPSDFGKHVTALGLLLARTRDRAFALARIDHYQKTRRDGEPKAPNPKP